MDTLTARLATVVSTLIVEAGQTQLGVSEATGIPRATLIRRLQGHSPFTVAELEAIAGVLGTSASELLDAADAPGEQVSA